MFMKKLEDAKFTKYKKEEILALRDDLINLREQFMFEHLPFITEEAFDLILDMDYYIDNLEEVIGQRIEDAL